MRTRCCRGVAVALPFAAMAMLWVGCDEDPSGLGQDTRQAPDTLQSLVLEQVTFDSVFAIPVSLGRSNVGQIGQRIAYTTHVLYAMRIPTRGVDEVGDTLAVDQLTFSVTIDTLQTIDFEGTMRFELREVEPSQRGWTTDSVSVGLPQLTAASLAPQVAVNSESFDAETLSFDITLANLADADSLALADSIEFNVALRFVGFDTGGPGFIEFPHAVAGTEKARIAAFGGQSSLYSQPPSRRLTVVEFDSTFSFADHLVMSDGYRLHTYLKFADLNTVLPDSAVLHLAQLKLTQVDSLDGTVFGEGPSVGIMVPSDTLMIFEEEQNTRALAFFTNIDAEPGATSVINVTAYLFDQQEDTVSNRGMLFRLSNEGTKVRHFEFYGPGDAMPSRRPHIQIFYSLPATFEEEGG